MATSQRKIEANRANALKSTGPRTRRGKRSSARNALAHGLTSRAALLPGDDPWEYRRFAAAILDELDPRGPLEEELAGEVANLSWKLRRAPGAEAILMEEKHCKDGAEERPPLRVIVNMILDRGHFDQEPRSPLWLLDRYTRNLERSRTSAVRTLLSLQKRRREREAEEEDDTVTRWQGDRVTKTPLLPHPVTHSRCHPVTPLATGGGAVARFTPVQNEAILFGTVELAPGMNPTRGNDEC